MKQKSINSFFARPGGTPAKDQEPNEADLYQNAALKEVAANVGEKVRGPYTLQDSKIERAVDAVCSSPLAAGVHVLL